MNLKERMEKERQEFLPHKERHPQLLKNQTSWDCGPGWHPILIDLCHVIQDIIDDLPMEIKGEMYVVQIKEKFGTLRFYMNQDTPQMQSCIMLAEIFSARICEDCGAPGTLRQGGWWKTRCDKCEAKDQKRKKKELDKWKKEQRERNLAKQAAETKQSR